MVDSRKRITEFADFFCCRDIRRFALHDTCCGWELGCCNTKFWKKNNRRVFGGRKKVERSLRSDMKESLLSPVQVFFMLSKSAFCLQKPVALPQQPFPWFEAFDASDRDVKAISLILLKLYTRARVCLFKCSFAFVVIYRSHSNIRLVRFGWIVFSCCKPRQLLLRSQLHESIWQGLTVWSLL